MDDDDEHVRLVQVYRGYESSEHEQWKRDQANPGNLRATREHQATLRRLLEREDLLPLSGRRLLDVGCGWGHTLERMVALGADPALCTGVDLLADRIEGARHRHPEMHFRHADARRLPLPDHSVDLVLLNVVFSSILDDDIAAAVAAEVTRVLAPGGAVVWYDNRYPTPGNDNVRRYSRSDVRRIFPEFSFRGRTVGLLPPVARRLGRTTPLTYPLLSALPPLRSKWLAVLRPPAEAEGLPTDDADHGDAADTRAPDGLRAMLGTLRGRFGATALAYLFALGLARVLGFGRESVIAGLFGAGRSVDAYVAATALPELLAGLLLSGLIGFGIIPAFEELRRDGREHEARDLIAGAMWHVLVYSGVIAVAMIVLARPAMTLIGPGLSGHALDQAVTMLRIASPAVVCYGIAGIAGAVLNARGTFIPVALCIAAGNAAAIVVLLAVPNADVTLAATAYVVSAALIAAGEIWLVRRSGFPLAVHRGRASDQLRRVLIGTAVALIVVSAPYVRIFFERVIASTLRPGDLAALGYATRLLLVVGSLIAVSVGTVSFPSMARHATMRDAAAMRRTVRQGLGLVAILSIPASVILFLFSSQIVRLVFGHGAFRLHAIGVTSSVLRAYAIGLTAMCLSEILLRGLLALRQARQVLGVVLVTLIATLGIDIWAAQVWGVAALGVVASALIWVNALAMALWLRHALGSPRASARRAGDAATLTPAPGEWTT